MTAWRDHAETYSEDPGKAGNRRPRVMRALLLVSVAALASLALVQFAGGNDQADAAAACSADGQTLQAAIRNYSNGCSQPRQDCDPLGGQWTCSSEQIGKGSPGRPATGATTVPSSTRPPTVIVTSPPTTEAPSTQPPPSTVRPPASGDVCHAYGSSRADAEKKYSQSCTERQVDCDPIDGRWVCADRWLIKGKVPGGGPTPAPAPAPSTTAQPATTTTATVPRPTTSTLPSTTETTRPPATTTAPKPPTTACPSSGSRSAAGLLAHHDFDSAVVEANGDLSYPDNGRRFRLYDSHDGSSVSELTSDARYGSTALELGIRKNTKPSKSEPGKERIEIGVEHGQWWRKSVSDATYHGNNEKLYGNTTHEIRPGDSRYLSFSFKLHPTLWDNPNTWFLLAQTKQVQLKDTGGGGPFIVLGVDETNRMSLMTRHGRTGLFGGVSKSEDMKMPAPLKRGVWYDVVLGYTFSPVDRGLGSKTLMVKQATDTKWQTFERSNILVGYSEMIDNGIVSRLSDTRVGIYKGGSDNNNVFNVDGIRYGTSLDAVLPTGC